jgi:hypothetical protein
MKIPRSPRTVSLAVLSLVFAIQVTTHLVVSLNRGARDPDLPKILAILAPDSGSMLRVVLGAAKRRDPDRKLYAVSLPDHWRSGPGERRLPHLMVFVDGRRIGFQREPPSGDDPPGAEPRSYYRHVGHRRTNLAISCPTTAPCRTAVIVAEDAALALALAWDRVGQFPLLLLEAAIGLLVWAVVAFRVARSPGVVRMVAGQALFLLVAAFWLSGRRYTTSHSAPLLALEVLALAFPLLFYRLPSGFPSFVVRDLVFLHDPTTSPRPKWWRGVSFAAVAGTCLLAFFFVGALGPPRGPLDDDYHMRDSFDIAVNRAVCGAPSATSRASSIRWGVETDPGLRAVPLRELLARDAGSVDEHCRSMLEPHLNRENSLALVMATWLGAEPALSFRDLGLRLQATRIVLLLVFVYVLLANGASLLLAGVLCCSGLAVLQNLEARYYSTYGFMVVLLVLMVAVLSYSLQRDLPSRWPGHVAVGCVVGWLVGFSVNMRTSHLPIYLLLLGLYLVMGYRGAGGRGPRRPSRLYLRWLAVGILCVGGCSGLFWLVHIRPLKGERPEGSARAYSQSFSYHPVAHSLVLALGVPPNPLARREGIQWTDASGLAVARRFDPQVSFLGEGYETVLFKYYFSLWAGHPGEMLELHFTKLRLAGASVVSALSNPSGTLFGAPFFRAVMWPLGFVPGGLTPLLHATIFGLAVFLYLKRGAPLAFTVALLMAISVMLIMESTLIFPTFHVFYNAPHMFTVLCASALAWQLILEAPRLLVRSAAARRGGSGWPALPDKRRRLTLLLILVSTVGAAVLIGVKPRSGELGLAEESGAEDAVLERLAALGYVETVDEAEPPSRDGVTVYDRDLASPGLNLFAPIGGMEGYLTTLDGRMVHSWSISPSLAPKGWYHLELLEDGGLLAITHKAEPDALIRLAFDGTVLWTSRLGHHHDVDIAEDGRIYALTQASRRVSYGPHDETIIDNSITVLSPSGVLQSQVSLLDLLQGIQSKKLESWVRRLHLRKGADDLLHTNTLEILRHSKGPVERGDLLLCSFSLGLLFVVDLEAREIVWTLGPEDVGEDGAALVGMAHMPTQLENGNFLVFVNGVSRKPPDSFFSETRGGAQPLPNGNVLITESDRGRAFEITRQGRVVWEYVMPRSGQSNERKAVYRVMRIPPTQAARLNLPWGSGLDF